jgi:hypothetical protein
VISQPVLVNVHKSGAVSADGKAEDFNLPSSQAGQQGLQNQSIPDPKPLGSGDPAEDQSAVKAQAAFRGCLVYNTFYHTLVQYLSATFPIRPSVCPSFRKAFLNH